LDFFRFLASGATLEPSEELVRQARLATFGGDRFIALSGRKHVNATDRNLRGGLRGEGVSSQGNQNGSNRESLLHFPFKLFEFFNEYFHCNVHGKNSD
jgi:hypothetical protein